MLRREPRSSYWKRERPVGGASHGRRMERASSPYVVAAWSASGTLRQARCWPSSVASCSALSASLGLLTEHGWPSAKATARSYSSIRAICASSQSGRDTSKAGCPQRSSRSPGLRTAPDSRREAWTSRFGSGMQRPARLLPSSEPRPTPATTSTASPGRPTADRSPPPGTTATSACGTRRRGSRCGASACRSRGRAACRGRRTGPCSQRPGPPADSACGIPRRARPYPRSRVPATTSGPVAFSPDGTKLANGSGRYESRTGNSPIRIWGLP